MHELRLVAVSEDGSYAIFEVPGRSGRFSLPIDDRLRTVARGQFSRLAQYEIEVENPLRPKEIQDRIRAGETAEDIADAAGVAIDQVRRFEGPPLADRMYRAQEAQKATIRSPGDNGPGPHLGDIVAVRLSELGASADEAAWDSRKRADGNWQVTLTFSVGSRSQAAEWIFDPRRRHITPDDDLAARLCLAEADLASLRIPATATVTPIAPRLSGVAALHAEQRGSAAPPSPVSAMSVPAKASPAPVPAPAPVPDPVPVPAPVPAPSPDAPAASAEPPAVGQRSPEAPGEQQPAETDADAESERPHGRPGRKTAGGRARRASVPSWDEIMFGNSRQPD
jgi:hypothetical protein